MCGLFGAIGKSINTHVIRALALINRERGTHGLGLFDNSGKSVKTGKDALKALTFNDFTKFINYRHRWFLAGHTRHATRGKINNRNAHPFRYGCIIGAHNGMVIAPKKYNVDSEYLFDKLNKSGGDYQTALADVRGYWGLTWYDGDNFYITAHDNSIYIGHASDGTFYYSSEKSHLSACIGRAQYECIDNGRVLRFSHNSTNYEELPRFISIVEKPTKRSKIVRTEIIPWGDYEYYDTLARRAGYTDFDTLCEVESFGDRTAAMAMLDDLFYDRRDDKSAYSYSEYWRDYTQGWD